MADQRSNTSTNSDQQSAAQRRTSRRNFIRYGVATTGALAAAMYVKPQIHSVGIPQAFASASGPPSSYYTHYCVYFDEAGISEADVIREQYSGLGLHISTKTYGDKYAANLGAFDAGALPMPKYPAVIFNSAAPTGGDTDLGTPNASFGGPGMPAGALTNDTALGNVLIIQERYTYLTTTNTIDDQGQVPDDKGSGGRIVFSFDDPVKIDMVDVLDIDDGNTFGSRVHLYDGTGTRIFSYMMPDLGNNSFQSVGSAQGIGNFTNVRRLEVIFKHSGAVAKVCWSQYPN
ncbi:MAG: hypothetical protein ACE5Q6_10495 [Dehalococcoidia bacterium]